MQTDQVPVFILCGGYGTRFKEETIHRPKPMIPIGAQPIVWHIMNKYARHGYRRFVLCLGYKGGMIRSFFGAEPQSTADQTLFYTQAGQEPWQVTLADTGLDAMTGARVAKAAAKHLGQTEHLAVTYGDGLTDADLAKQWDWHLAHEQIGTVLGVNPPSRFGEFQLEGDLVLQFNEKPRFTDRWINGGFFLFKRSFLDYLNEDNSCILERTPLSKLAKDRQLAVYKHEGFWACMDTRRDQEQLNEIWQGNQAPWR